MSRVTDEPVTVLHVRPYRETSLLVNVFSLHHGLMSAVARGGRGKRLGTPLQPFNRLRAGWFGRGSLVTLNGVELETQPSLSGDALVAGFYLIELVMRLVREGESVPRLYAGLGWAVDRLSASDLHLEIVLRSFEKLMLEELGYGLDFSRDAQTGQRIKGGCWYSFEPGVGFVVHSRDAGVDDRLVIAGDSLLSIGEQQFESPVARRDAKRVFRQALAQHLGPKPLASRRLLRGKRMNGFP